MNYYAVN